MKIEFRRIGHTPKEFEVYKDGIIFRGTLELKKRNLIELKADISGNLEIDCDVCAKSFDRMIKEKSSLLLSYGIYEGENDTLDVYEIFTEIIDIDEILDSELEVIKSDYYKCNECEKLED